MRTTILAIGSRGDVQPYLALGLGLQRAGHDVCLATHSLFQPMADQYGLTFAPLEPSPREFMKRFNAAAAGKRSGLVRKVLFWQFFAAELADRTDQFLNCCHSADVILYSQLSFPGSHLAAALEIPGIAAFTNPILPTARFAHPLFAGERDFGGLYNWLSYSVEAQFRWQPVRHIINRWRQDRLGLPSQPVWARAAHPVLTLVGCSPAVVPDPVDWPDNAHMTGYWFLPPPADWQPPPELVSFLRSGTPPVYVGFGSMIDGNPQRLQTLIIEALQRSGQRGIVVSGWSEFSQNDWPEDVLYLPSVPHDWLFPQVAAVVHHGGAGTTAAGLRAGVPTVVVPFGGDQPFWGQRVAQVGAGPAPIRRRDLTAAGLGEAIAIATQRGGISTRARAIGHQLRAENGVSNAVQLIHDYANSA